MASERPSRSLSGKDYKTKKISYGLFSLEFDSNNQEQQTQLILNAIGDSKDFMQSVAVKMREFIQANISSGKYRDLAESTKKKKASLGQPLQPLIGTGHLRDNLEIRFRKGYAAVKRPKDDWWTFLVALGVGRLDERNFMELDSSQASSIYNMIEKYLTEAMETK